MSAQLEVGERYVQVWAPDNGRVPFTSIITIWGGGTLWAINWEVGNGVHLRPIKYFTLTTATYWRQRVSSRHQLINDSVALVCGGLCTGRSRTWQTCHSENVDFQQPSRHAVWTRNRCPVTGRYRTSRQFARWSSGWCWPDWGATCFARLYSRRTVADIQQTQRYCTSSTVCMPTRI